MSAALLFYDLQRRSLAGFLAEREQEAIAAVDAVPHDEILVRSDDDLVERFVDRFALAEPRVNRDRVYAPKGTEDDVVERKDAFYHEPVKVPAMRLDVHVPVDGPAEAFTRPATTMSTSAPVGRYERGELILTVFVTNDELGSADLDDRVRAALDELLDRVDRHAEWAANDIESYNRRLATSLRAKVGGRRRAVLGARHLEASLGIPVRRTDPAPVLAVDVARRRPVVARAPARSEVPFTPEPALTAAQLVDVLEVVLKWREGVERLPNTFAPMAEEVLRDTLLVALNGTFSFAGGELVRRNGKTDLTVLVAGPGDTTAAAFVAELKFWRGPKSFTSAIDQLLGYTLWRDATVTLLLTHPGPQPVVGDRPSPTARHDPPALQARRTSGAGLPGVHAPSPA